MTKPGALLALSLLLGLPAVSARAQDDPEIQPERVLRALALPRPGRTRLLRLTPSDDGAGRVTILVQGSRLDADGEVIGIFLRWVDTDRRVYTALPDAPERATPIQRLEAARFDGCERAARTCREACAGAACGRCGAAAEDCIFGEQVLLEAGDATLTLTRALDRSDRRSGVRAATLRWGDATLEVRVPTQNSIDAPLAYWPREQEGMQVTRLSRRRSVLALTLAGEGDEDPPAIRRYFVRRGDELVEIRDSVIGSFLHRSVVPGDGTIRVRGTDWADCERIGYPETAPRTEVVFRISDAGEVLSARRRRVGGHWRCDELAACPYVDVVRDGRPERVGEILRNVRFEPQTQTLAIGEIGERTTVRLSEEKPETTYLDAVWVEVDGVRIAPAACETVDAPAYCVADGRYFELTEGETLDLQLERPDAPAAEAHLVALGYYRPHPPSPSSSR
ncbi:MAG: hypothetical protein VYE22_27040 [Myxococcota bacterium]|nr:hypothetical protein [Myxococcota bacterium]